MLTFVAIPVAISRVFVNASFITASYKVILFTKAKTRTSH